MSEYKEENVGPGIEPLSFVSTEVVGQLLKKIRNVAGDRAQELTLLRDEITDPYELVKSYIEPHLQDRNPSIAHGEVYLPVPRQAAFTLLNRFLDGGIPQKKDGRHQMFLLSDAAMGKSSLLLMIRLMQLAGFWPRAWHCELFTFSRGDPLTRIADMKNKSDTVLLLDGLNEDHLARNRIHERILELLRASCGFRRVIISCRSHFFPDLETAINGQLIIRGLAGCNCPILYLSPFNSCQARKLIRKRLPGSSKRYLRLQRFGTGARKSRTSCLLNQLRELRAQPIFLQQSDILLKKLAERREWNLYTVYEALVHQWIDRIRYILKKNYLDDSSPPEPAEIFYSYVRVALWMESRDLRKITEKKLRKVFCRNADVRWMAPLHTDQCSLLIRTSEGTFRFSHSTFREFFLAYALIRNYRSLFFSVRATDCIIRFLELAGKATEHVEKMKLTDFNPLRYVDAHRSFLPWRDRIRGKEGMGPKMVILPGGRFRMGDTQDGSADNTRHVREVELDSFALGCYPVTFAEYNDFCRSTGRRSPKNGGWGGKRRPVINVSWHDAEDYCEWLSRVTGRNYRLPTEAEWEYGCRAGSESIYCFGDDKSKLDCYAWYGKNAGGKTRPVGEKQANAWGLYDMHGNVWEWCADWYKENYSSDWPVRNPVGTKRGAGRVLRGGSWDSSGNFVRSSFRFSLSPGLQIIRVGFRVAMGH